MNLTGFEQFHEEKGDDKADHCPFEASQSEVEHPGEMVAQASETLKGRCSHHRLRAAGCRGGPKTPFGVSELD